MQLEHEFVVPVPVDQAWDVLLDVERIAPCMPGATVESFDSETG
ncbi:MAG: carbon monoxide dehydrogenase, partial [Actinomycetes bacterium]